MLNNKTTVYNKQLIDIKPACMGTLQKSSEKSFFVRCHARSQLADKLLCEKALYYDTKVQVLQVMLFGDEQMLAELLPESEK